MANELLYVALGDSAGVGFGAKSGGGYPARLLRRLRERGHDAALVNLCGNGATSQTVRDHQLGRALALRPRVATVCVGINDLWRGLTETQYARNLDHVVAQLRAAGVEVVLPNLPDLSHAPVAALVPRALYAGRFEAMNAAIAAAASRHGAVHVDVWTPSQRLLPGRPELFCDDGLHASAEGYEHFAEIMWPAFEGAALYALSRAALSA